MKRPAQIFNFRIQNASSGSVDVYIDGEIVDASTQEIYKLWFGDETSVSFKSFRDQLEASGASTFNIYINSPGGQVTDAMAMHDYLVDQRSKGKKVNTYGRGIIASAATYILMAGDSPEMSTNSWFMIHNVSGMAWGDVNEVERTANTLRKFNNAVRDFYSNATGIRKEDITKMMDAETWMTGEEAKNKGFVKQLSNEVSFTNLLSTDYWEYSNKDVLAAYNSAVKTPPATPADIPANIQQFILNQNDDMKKFFQNIVDAIRNVKPAEGADQVGIANLIADAVGKPFEELSNEIETTITNKVTEAETRIQNALKKEYDDKVTNLTTKVTALETKNTALETELADQKGKKTTTGNNQDDGIKPIGAFNKG
jgi:ATP-dependent Clp protease protease subunit